MGYTANICLISSIKGRSVYASHFRLIQHGIGCVARGDRIIMDFHGNQDAYIAEIFFDRDRCRSIADKFDRAKCINDLDFIHSVLRVGLWEKSDLKITPTLGNL